MGNPGASTPSAMDHRISLIFPFDVGETYIFYVSSGTQEAGKEEKIENAWDAIFKGNGWHTTQFPSTFSKPLGLMARLKLELKEGSNPEKALKTCPWLERKGLEAEAYIFPFGIGVLLLKARVIASHDLASALSTYWTDRPKISKAFGEILAAIAKEFTGALEIEAKNKKRVYKLSEIDRGKVISHARYSFPIVFHSDQAEYSAAKEKERSRSGKGAILDPTTSTTTGSAQEFSYSYSPNVDAAKVYVGWSEAHVLGAGEKIRNAIEIVFIIAMSSWYALIVMNKIASAHLLQAFRDIAAGESRALKKKSRTMRLTFMEAANASYPIRWTTAPQDLGLLERIHSTWSSNRLRRNVEEQTNALATHHDQLEEEEQERKGSLLAVFGIGIACLTLASAVADVITLLPVKYQHFKETHGWQLSLALPAILGVILALYLNWSKIIARYRERKTDVEPKDDSKKAKEKKTGS
jgi:hypothetical protein